MGIEKLENLKFEICGKSDNWKIGIFENSEMYRQENLKKTWRVQNSEIQKFGDPRIGICKNSDKFEDLKFENLKIWKFKN